MRFSLVHLGDQVPEAWMQSALPLPDSPALIFGQTGQLRELLHGHLLNNGEDHTVVSLRVANASVYLLPPLDCGRVLVEASRPFRAAVALAIDGKRAPDMVQTGLRDAAVGRGVRLNAADGRDPRRRAARHAPSRMRVLRDRMPTCYPQADLRACPCRASGRVSAVSGASRDCPPGLAFARR